MKRSSLLVTLVVLLGLVGVAPAGAGPHADATICVVTDWEGFDQPFAAEALAGAEQAARRNQLEVESFFPDSEESLFPLLAELVDGETCDLLVGVGFWVAGAAEPLVYDYPDQLFTFIDFAYPDWLTNVASVQFRADQPSFVAGYTAAGISETGAVGVYGGMPIPAVTQFMDGYALGVEFYNERYGTQVDVLGWDVDTQTGLFTEAFQDPGAGYDATIGLFESGADTVFAVAGGTGEGSLTAAAEWKAAGHMVRVIEPDYDWYLTYGDEARVLLTSVLKKTGVAAFHQVEAFAVGSWTPGWVWEDLASDGVGLARYHKTNDQVPAELREDLKPLMDEIAAGGILTSPWFPIGPVGSPANPVTVVMFSWEYPLLLEPAIVEEVLVDMTGLAVSVVAVPSFDSSLAYLCGLPGSTVAVVATAYAMPAYDMCGADPVYKAVRFGSDVYWTQFLAPRDSGYLNLADFAGKMWAYSDHASLSSYIVPRGMFNIEGIEAGEDLWAGSHWEAALAVYNGTTEIATTYFSPPITPGDPWQEGDPPDIPDEYVDDCVLVGDPPGQLWCDGYRVLDPRQQLARELETADVVEKVEIVMISPGIPNDGLSFGGQMPDDVRAVMADAFEEMADEGSPYHAAFLDSFGVLYSWQELSPADISEYEWIAEVLAAAGQ